MRIPYLNHGRRHHPSGSDQLPGVIVYEYANVDEWLKIAATGEGPNGFGIYMFATGAPILIQGDDAQDLLLQSDGGNVGISSSLGGKILLGTDGGLIEFSTNGGVFRVVDGGGGVVFQGGASSTFQAYFDGGSGLFFEMNDGTDRIKFVLPVGAVFEVLDHNGAAVFRVDEDGDLHGKTGKALTFDL